MSKKKKTTSNTNKNEIETEVVETAETSVSSSEPNVIETKEVKEIKEQQELKEIPIANEIIEEEVSSSEDINKVEEKEVSDVIVTETENCSSALQEEKVEEVQSTSKRSYKTTIILSISFIVILLLFLLFSTIFALIYGSKATIIDGVQIKGIDVSSLTREQALEKVLQTFQSKLEQPITLKHNEYETTVFAQQFDVAFALEESVNMAYAKGRSRKYFSE